MRDEAAVRALAEKIRVAYVESALGSYEDASANGLCAQGAWECAVDAIRRLDISDLLEELTQTGAGQVATESVAHRSTMRRESL